MYPTASAGPDEPTCVTDPAQLPTLLQQLVADLADPTVTYLLGTHYYERTNHARTRHFPAVFALRQGEVWNVEVSVDSVAFDTELVHYPERGEPHYPGPWADRFRATVPFAQLYQLCRKVLTPAELTATDFAYGPEHVRYYNHAVHQQYPLLTDIQPAYAAVPFSGEHPLGAVLAAVAAGLLDPHNHYLVTTTSFESPDGPVGMGVLHLQALTVWDVEIDATGFTWSVLLHARDRRHKSPVRVAFANVWQVLRSDSPHMDLAAVEAAGGLLYEAPQVLSAYAQQGRPA